MAHLRRVVPLLILVVACGGSVEEPRQATTLCAAHELGDLSASDAPAIGKLQMDILVAALACDLTRVATFMWMNGTSGLSSPWLGISDNHHALSHEGDDDAGAKRKLIEITTWHAEQFAYLLGEMTSRPGGDDTLLEHTVILWGGTSSARATTPHATTSRSCSQGAVAATSRRAATSCTRVRRFGARAPRVGRRSVIRSASTRAEDLRSSFPPSRLHVQVRPPPSRASARSAVRRNQHGSI